MPETVSSRQVIGFRLHAHHLDERLAEDALLDAAGRCAIQDSPPGSALLAISARVDGVTRARVEDAVATDKSLMQTWSLRGAPFCFPTADAPVFTTGALPPTEEGMGHLLPGVVRSLDRLGMTVTEAVERTGAEIADVLSRRRLTINELGGELAPRIGARLTGPRRDLWQAEGPYARGQPLGEGVVHFCVRILALQGVVCFAPRVRNRAPFVLVEEWLGVQHPRVDPVTARAELVRRYLRCYGPSTPAGLAAWLGVQVRDTAAWWGLVEAELVQVQYGGEAWLLAEDLDAVRSAPGPQVVRLLPPHDPYTQLHDRETIVDEPHRGEVWRTVGGPGTLLVDGRVAGTWRPRTSGRRLTIAVTPFGPLAARTVRLLQGEADRLGPLRGASAVEVAITDR